MSKQPLEYRCYGYWVKPVERHSFMRSAFVNWKKLLHMYYSEFMNPHDDYTMWEYRRMLRYYNRNKEERIQHFKDIALDILKFIS